MDSKLRGRTLKLYLVDGTPQGVMTAELGVSSLQAAVASRAALPELIRREEAARTGMYLLIGPDPAGSERPLVYVGEADQVRTRLAAHDADPTKDFFIRAVLVVSKDQNLTKAHARYLESRILAAIKSAGRAELANGTEPLFKGLPEPGIADMERVLREIEILLPVLGFDVLRPVDHGNVASAPAEIGVATRMSALDALFAFTEASANAKGRESGDEFVVLADSLALAREVPSCSEGISRRRAQFIADGALVQTENGKHLRFVKDIAFGSSSSAASVVYGGSASGSKYWLHVKTGQSYGEWRKQRMSLAAGA